MSRTRWFVTFSLIILILAGCTPASKKENDFEMKQQQARVEIIELAKAHGAVLIWEQGSEPYYSITLTKSLVQSGQPVLFDAILDDVFIRDGQYYARFDRVVFLESGPAIYLTLEVTPDQAQQLVIPKPELWSEFAIVAQVTSIKKMAITQVGTPLDSESVELDIESSDRFIASGKLIDWKFIEEWPLYWPKFE